MEFNEQYRYLDSADELSCAPRYGIERKLAIRHRLAG